MHLHGGRADAFFTAEGPAPAGDATEHVEALGVAFVAISTFVRKLRMRQSFGATAFEHDDVCAGAGLFGVHDEEGHAFDGDVAKLVQA